MSTVLEPTTQSPPQTLAELVKQLGDIPLERIRMQPPPGTATEEDAVKTRLCELVDGVLVEKAMGYPESRLGFFLGRLLDEYGEQHGIGYVAGADALTRFKPGLLREPDISFVRWERVPGGEVSDEPIGKVTPDLAVEVVSIGNSRAEIERKKNEYFNSGVAVVWIVYPRTKSIRVWTAKDGSFKLTSDDVLTGGDILPGFSISVRELFKRAKQQQKRRPDDSTTENKS
jgi:Uma2 family endonuclease